MYRIVKTKYTNMKPTSKSTKLKIPSFSYFQKPISNVQPKSQVDLLDVYHLIKSETFLTQTNTLRNLGDTQEARDFKSKNFDYVTFSGTFSKRCESGLIKHSELLSLDIDDMVEIIPLMVALLVDQYFDTQLLFTSPSGKGIKWIISIDLTIASHNEYFQAVANYLQKTYKVIVDPICKDVTRACFLPHDANVTINPNYL